MLVVFVTIDCDILSSVRVCNSASKSIVLELFLSLCLNYWTIILVHASYSACVISNIAIGLHPFKAIIAFIR
jgi:hypothetical protein